MMTWKCGTGYRFFNLTTGACQTACGGFTIQNNVTGNCDPCGGTCYQCAVQDTNKCTYCASYLFFKMDENGDCVCFDGYIHVNSSCQLCDYGSEGCLACTYDDGAGGTLPYDSTKYTCSQCNTTIDYFLNSTNLCEACSLSNCDDCESLKKCASCASGYDYSDEQTCIICSVTGCINCSAVNTNKCTTCNQTMGYYNNATSGKCSAKCGDGIYVSAEQGCDDNNTDNFDGCSSTCTVETGFDCSGSPSSCFYKQTVTLSLKSQKMENENVVCNTITFKIEISPKGSILDQNYINWTNFISTPNTSLVAQN